MGRRKRKTNRVETPQPAVQRPRPWERWLWLVIVAGGIAAYVTSFDGVFLLDDDRRILGNDSIRSLWPLWSVLSHGTRPLVNLSLAINYGASELNVFGYHLFNLVVHLLAGLALFGIVGRTMRTPRFSKVVGSSGPWLAMSVALIWVVHPLNTQAVTYIIQRGESMMGLLYLLTLYCSIRAAGSAHWRWAAAAVFTCAAGMACKPVMVTAPVIVILYDVFFLDLSIRDLLRRRGWLYAGLLATWGMLFALGVVSSTFNAAERADVTVGFGYKGVSAFSYALTQPWAIVQYLKLTVWPASLCLDYGWPVAKTGGMIAFPVVLLLAIVGGVLWLSRRHRWVLFLVAWFFVILSPTSSFIPIRDTIFEHRMYLSLASLVCGGVVGGWWLLGKLVSRGACTPAMSRLLGVGALVVVVGGLTARTAVRNRDYADPMRMWQDVAAQRPDNPRARCWIGVLLRGRGDLAGAEEAYRQSLAIDPAYTEARINLASVLVDLGKFREGADAWRGVIAADANFAHAHFALADALARLGDHANAVDSYETSLRLDPSNAQALYNYGNSLRYLRRSEDAIDAYRRSIALVGDNPSSHNNLGLTLLDVGDRNGAVDAFRQTIRLNPRHLNGRYNLATTLAELGRHEEAEVAFRELLSMSPRDLRSMYGLGQSLVAMGRASEAIGVYRRALELAPGHPAISRALDEATDGQ